MIEISDYNTEYFENLEEYQYELDSLKKELVYSNLDEIDYFNWDLECALQAVIEIGDTFKNLKPFAEKATAAINELTEQYKQMEK